MKKTYLDATQEQGKNFYLRQIQGNVTMLNLPKFRERLLPIEENKI